MLAGFQSYKRKTKGFQSYKRKDRQNNPSNADQLIQAGLAKWINLPQGEITNWIDSMSRQIRAFIDAGAGNTDY